VVLVALVAGLAGLLFFALPQRGLAPPQASSVPSPQPATIGAVEMPEAEGIIGPRISLAGWALDPTGIRAVEVRVGGNAMPARIGIERADIAALHPGFPESARAGFALDGDLSAAAAAPGTDRRVMTVVAIAKDGRETTLARKSLIDPAALTRWNSLANSAPSATPPFYLLPALAAISLGGARDLDRRYTPYLSSTVKGGMRVPILYLRTTFGPARDYAFDPDWDTRRRCGERRRRVSQSGSNA